MKKLYIIGAGAFGRDTADTVFDINEAELTYEIAGFIDDDKSLHGESPNGIKVLGGIDDFIEIAKESNRKPCAVIAVADGASRKMVADQLDVYVEWENIIHPMAIIKKSASIGTGNIVQHFSSIESNASLGNHCIVNTNSCICHDVIMEDFTSVMPNVGLMGWTRVEECAYIGVGAITIQNVTIGKGATVGAGAVVIKDVEAGSTVVGNPLRRIK
jgi:sugar O-acyltransferase (sialic acid O-acetyltransferase NeuD family)